MVSALRHTSATRASKLVAASAAACALLAAVSVAVLAAGRKPDFKLSAAPTAVTVAGGQTASYTVRLKRVRRFGRAVTLKAAQLPAGASATWKLANGAALRRGTLTKKQSVAVLTVRVPAAAAPGTYNVAIKASSGKLRHAASVAYTVSAPANPPPPVQTALRVGLSPATQTLVQGGDAVYTVSLSRSNFGGPVNLGVTGLPSGVTATWVGGSSVNGDTAQLKLTAAANAPQGSSSFRVTASGGGASASASATVTVKPTLPLQLSGDASDPLAPGTSSRLDLTISNPYDFNLLLISIDVTVDGATSTPACPASANFDVVNYHGSYPVVVPPGSSKLAALVPASALPRVRMLNLPTNQDACKDVALSLHYKATATR